MTIFGCAKVYRTAEPSDPKFIERQFLATPNEVYYALQWALKVSDYPIAEENLAGGIIHTRYVPVKATSHYVEIFGRKDYGVTGAYHQLEVQVLPAGEETKVRIGSRVKGIVSNLKSSFTEEKKVLADVSNYLRDPNVRITNLGVKE